MSLVKPILGSKPFYTGQAPVLDFPYLGIGDFTNYANPTDIITNNGPIHASLRYGPALRFNGTSDFIALPIIMTSPPFTVIATVRPRILQTGTVFWLGDKDASNEYYAAYVFSDGTVAAFQRTAAGGIDQAITTATYAAGEEIQVAYVFESDNSRSVFLNGENKVTNTGANNAIASDRVSIGVTHDSSPSFWFDGEISSVRVYCRVLSDSEIKSFHDDPWRDYREENQIIQWAATQVTPTGVVPTQYYNQFLQGVA